MKAPLSWLNDYVDVTLKPEVLSERLTEVGLGTEKITRENNDVIFDLEITPNRPDWLSIVGIAREIAAIENKKVKLPKVKLDVPQKTTLPITLKPNFNLAPRWTGIVISSVSVKPSPTWLQERLKKLGQKPINNLVDITNYVMFELGIPLHAFDYDLIKDSVMTIEEAKGGEKFTSVDEKTYSLPKNAIIIKDSERIIDLVGIKGGLNSGINEKTKNIFLHVTIVDPVHVRRASLALALRSDASAIYERGTDKGGTLRTLERAASLILELSGGELASEIIDLKKEEFEPWIVKITKEHLDKVLGIVLPEKEVVSLLERLNFSVKVEHDEFIVTVPTYRNDVKIPEDLIEEVARLYGYNKFPKTMPEGQIPTQEVPYYKNYRLDEQIKNALKAAGFFETYTYSLINEKDLLEEGKNPEKTLRVDNPVSRDYEYLRPTLMGNLRKAAFQNLSVDKKIHLFELGKVYLGKSIADYTEEYRLSGISTSKSFHEIKGILERLFSDFGISEDPTKQIHVYEEGIGFEINYTEFLEKINLSKKFIPIPKFPPIIEDMSFVATEKVKTGDLLKEIQKQSTLISEVTVLDTYRDTRTFHIVYQSKDRNLTDKEVGEIREKIIEHLKTKFSAKIK